jgi:glutamine synthetase
MATHGVKAGVVSKRLGLGLGTEGFVGRHGLYSDEQARVALDVVAQIEELGLRTVRLILVDQHGVARSKHVSGEGAIAAMRNGADFSGAIYSLDTGNRVFPPAFVQGGGFGIEEFTGFPDVVVVPDPTTFRLLPWADRSGWMICDVYFGNGRPVPLDGRAQLRAQLARLREAGYGYVAGLEVELYITRLARPGVRFEEVGHGEPGQAPEVEVFERGYQFLSDVRLDGVGETLEAIRDGLWDLGLPPRSIEDEWGPGQIEFTFSPMEGFAAADAMIVFRSAVKAICSRRGLLASFMCWPALANFFPSGWHLHESLVDPASGANAFASDSELLTPLGRHFVAGLIESASAMAVFAAPTLNGYARFRPYSFAPDRVTWAANNRGTLISIQGAPGNPGTHVENRLGEPAANPYLWLAANIAAGLDGITRRAKPPPIVTDDPYASEATLLPKSLGEAVDALASSDVYRAAFGDALVDYLVMMKRAEIAAHASAADTGAWEMAEYFEMF